MAVKAGLEVRFLTVAGAGKLDPDLLFLEQGLAAYEPLRRGAESAMAFACRAALPQPVGASAEQKARAAQSVFEVVAAAESAVARAEFLQETATHLRLPGPAVEQDFAAFAARIRRQTEVRTAAQPQPLPAASPVAKPVETSAHTPEHHLLILCLHFEDLGKPLSHALPHEWIDTRHMAGAMLNRFLGEFEQDAWPGRDNLDTLLESPEERTLVAGLLFEAPRVDDPFKVAQEGLRQLRARHLEPRLRQIELALATSGSDSDSDPISLLKERSELQRQLRLPVVLAPAV
jgi:DNA primase